MVLVVKVSKTCCSKITPRLIPTAVESTPKSCDTVANGQTIVEEDFQLICFDFVSEPSTTGAFMMQESKQPNIITKADRINRALNDILREK